MSDKNDYTPVPTTQDELQPSKQQDVPDDDVENKSSGDDTQVQSVAQKEIKKEKPPAASFRQLFRFADIFDIFLMLLGTIGAIVQGSVLPIQYLIFGGLSDAFIGYARCPRLNTSDSTNCTRVDIEAELARFSQYYVAIAFCLAVAIVVQLVTWGITAERQVHKIRKAYFKSILRQDMTWFDTFDSGELNTRLTDDLSKIADGMGYKFAMVVQSLAGLISGYTLGFSHGWKLTLVIISVFPLVVMAGGFASSFVTSLSAKEGASYAAAGSIAQEALSSVRTVVAFGGEKKETERYDKCLKVARAMGEKKGFATGLSFGVYTLLMYSSYSLSFWYGGKLVINKEMSGGDILVVFFSVMAGSALVGQAGPNFQAITAARAAAYEIFAMVDRVPSIDIYSDEGIIPESLGGDIAFEDVCFSYPTRPDVQVLTNFSLHVTTGQKIAVVGESGCGKTTLIKLLQRFYDCTEGTVKIDGNEIERLNLKWLRQQIGVVSQEPVLFATTITENISYGRDGVTQEEIEKAAKVANAHNFIEQLPEGYETLCGERGAQLSGGQKQRIAIARAVLRNPQVLLLDEATSALDTESESLVKEALDRAGEGRTTIVIAHRLSTVRNADLIVAIQDGKVAEKGTHDELIEKNGVYKELVTLQMFGEDTGDVSITKLTGEDSVQHPEKFDSQKFEVANADNDTTNLKNEDLPLEPDTVPLVQIKDKDKETVEKEVEPASILRIIKFAKTEWRYYLVGTFGASLMSAYPFVFAFLLAELLGTFQNDLDSPLGKQKIQEGTRFWALLFLAMAGGTFIGHFLQYWMYGVAGEILTERLRKKAFEWLLTQDVSYFDDPCHSTGALTANLASHASEVKGALGSRIGLITSSFLTAFGCLLLAFYSGWKLTLVVLAFIPFLVVAGFLRSKFFLAGKAGKTVDVEEAGKVAVEVIQNIQTVASLTREDTFYNKYIEMGSKIYKQRRHQSVVSGLLMSFSMPVFLLSSAAAFRFAGYLVANDEMTFPEVMKTILAVQLGSVFFGQMTAFVPDYVKAKVAASRLFKLFDTMPSIKTDSNSNQGARPDTVEGLIKFEDVTFSYPFRSDSKVLQGLCLEIQPGKTVALVGASGCGKSTVVSLIERLYDIDSGSLTMDGKNVKSFDVSFLRSQMGIVSQEPVLFNYSIRENIAYGDTDREISQEEIEKVAKVANIHDFISALPESYDTVVGDKGTLISGGQKQRIAIARALIRNPKILLLDEATSALDTESEKMVQEALDRASVGRTTIVIAHRLSTIQKADLIAVIKAGQVVEKGTHQTLMEMKAVYYNLQQSQDTSATN